MADLPKYGILSKQIVRSPIIKAILPAKLRHGQDLDLVFIHETYLEVYEVSKESKLNRTGLLNLDCKIEAAAVLSLTTDTIKQEQPDDPEQLPDAVAQSPPLDVILLKMDSHQVFFVHYEMEPIAFNFRTTIKPLPAVPSSRYQVPSGPGDLLAVNSKGSAIAIAGLDCGIVLYSYPCTPQCQDAVIPIAPRLTIIKMVFLHPPASDEHRADLLVLGFQDRRLVVYVYHWDTKAAGPWTAAENPSRHVLGKEHVGVPVLLVPLELSGAFIIIDENIMATYQYGYDGSVRQLDCSVLPRLGQDDGTSLRRPLWTTWTRARARKPLSNMSEDAIYLAREDGLLRYMLVTKAREKVVLSTDSFIETGIKMDQAFAVVTKTRNDIFSNGGLLFDESIDLLAIGGCGCDGGVFSILHDPEGIGLKKIEALRNWAPFVDTAQIPISPPTRKSAILSQTDSTRQLSCDGLLVTSGTGQSHVARVEHCSTLSHSSSYSFPDLREIIDDLWVMEDNHENNGNATMLCSQPWGSLLVHNTPALQYHVKLGDERTLAAFGFPIGYDSLTYLVQVTPTQMIVFDINLLLTEDALEAAIVDQENFSIRCAAFQHHFVALAITKDDDCVVHLRKVSQPGGLPHLQQFGGGAASSGSDITCMAFMQAPGGPAGNNYPCLVAGTNDGRVVIYSIDDLNGLSKQPRLEIEIGKPIDSITCLTGAGSKFESLILCGLRTGDIHAIPISAQFDPNLASNAVLVQQMRQIQNISIGSTTVKLLDNKGNRTSAHAVCDNQLSKITWSKESADKLLIQKIRTNNSYNSIPIRLYTACSIGGKTDCLAIASSVGIHVGHLTPDDPVWRMRVAEPKSANRHSVQATDTMSLIEPEPTYSAAQSYNIAYNPQRVQYIAALSALVVGSTSYELDPATKTRYSGSAIHINQHVINPLIKLEHRVEPGVWHSSPNERLTSLLHWKWPRGHSHMLIAGFKVTGDDGVARGVIKYLKVSVSKESDRLPHYKINLIHSSQDSSPVYTLAQAGVLLLIGVGSKLRMRPFDRAQKKFLKGISVNLPSTAVYITVSNPEDLSEQANKERRVYITTNVHSIQVFAFDGTDEHNLYLLASDPHASDGISHLVLEPETTTSTTDNTTKILVTTKSNTLRLLSLASPSTTSPTHAASRILTLHTELTLPTGLTRLHHANLRPFATDASTSLPGITTPNLYGTGADGSIWTFSLLSREAWWLLSTLERLVLRDEALTRQYPGIGAGRREVAYVRGDVLARLLERRDAVDVLRGMLARAESALGSQTSPNPLAKLEVLTSNAPLSVATPNRIVIDAPSVQNVRKHFLQMLAASSSASTSAPALAQYQAWHRIDELASQPAPDGVLEAVVEWAKSVVDVVVSM